VINLAADEPRVNDDSTTRRVPRWIARVGGLGDSRFFLLIAAPLLAIYLPTATYSRPDTIDSFTNVLTAWQLGTNGTFLLDDHLQLADPDYYGNIAWVVPVGESAASQYPPGAASLAAPLYALWPEEARLTSLTGGNKPDVAAVEILHPSLAPAAITASLVTAMAVGLLGVTFRRLGGPPQMALIGAYLAGLGTSAWSVAADQLWQHGPGMLWIALALFLSDRHAIASGFAFGAAVLTRPPTAVIAAATGLYQAWKERSLRPALRIGIGALIGLGLFIAYNNLIFGSPSISAGYGTGFQDQALNFNLIAFAKNIFLGAFSASRGFLIWSPFLVVLIPGLLTAWKAAPGWVRGSALGGLLYLLIQYKANRFSGGGGFFAYRYPLEMLTAAAPLLYLSYREWVAPRPTATRAFTLLAKASFVLHGIGALVGFRAVPSF
jgi:alpha-1,2-mannosyltransferase